MDKVGKAILMAAAKGPDIGAVKDGLSWFKEKDNYDEVSLERLRSICVVGLKKTGKEEWFESYRLAMLISAPHSFDQFMQYLEIDRRPQDRFYLPRREKLMPFVKALQKLSDGRLKEVFCSMPPRVGKALANDTPVLTSRGWKNHGDLKVGDRVIGRDGKFKTVLAVGPKCDLDVLIEFTNGEKIQCHERHEWLFYDHGSNKLQLKEAKYYEGRRIENGPEGKRGHRYIFQLPKKDYVKGRKKKLPLDPYTLGVWLGDGTNTNPTITGSKEDRPIIDKIIANGATMRWTTQHKTTGVMQYGFDFRPQLRSMGMCHSGKRMPKHIPEEYLTASVEQRLELLAGLIDADGTLRREENRYTFTTCEEPLRDSFLELIATFGWRTSVVAYDPVLSSSGVQGRKPTYCIGFNPDCEIPCELERKQIHVFSKRRAVGVKSITRVEPKQGNCITVEDGFYLVGKTLIPTHNSTMTQMFNAFMMGRNTEAPTLYCTYTDTVVETYYNGLMEILTDVDTYNYLQIFPEAGVCRTDAKAKIIDLNRRKHYPSFTGRPIGGSLNGSCDASGGLIIGDDLCSGIEEAMSPDRLRSLWAKVDNNLIPRGKENSCFLWIGTRWSVADPIGVRQELLTNSPQFKDYPWESINIPALNDRDQSNFDYKYDVGFSTYYYRQRRASFERSGDIASWNAQFMGQPIEREGTVFEPDGMNYYNGQLPGDPDRVFMVVDPAWGGGDFVAAPVCYQYGEEIYVPDVVYSNLDKSKTQPLVANMVLKHGVTRMYIEGTKTTSSYGEGVSKILKEGHGYPINIKTSFKNAMGGAAIGKNKTERIYQCAPEIKERFVFLADGKRSKEYSQFMQNVFSFKIIGKNLHDDAPDSLQMALGYAFPAGRASSVVKSRGSLGI